jgi:short-subunit dehydrogenase
MELNRARIVLTGATGGLGEALVRRLRAAGALLLVTGRNPEQLAHVREVGGTGCRALQADLTTIEGRAAVTQAGRECGANVLINNAGVGGFGLLAEQTEEGVERILETNLVAPIQLTRALLPTLAAQPAAAVVNIGSAFGSIPLAWLAAYTAAKTGLHGFSQALRRELADSRVRVIHVSPRAIDTPLNPPAVVALNKALGNTADSPDAVAAHVVRMLEQDTPDALIGFPERLFAWLNGVAPALVDRGVRGKLALIKQHAADCN